MSGYIWLAAAIVLEGIGTAFLKLSDGFSKLGYSVAVGLCYLGAFWLLAVAIKQLPVGLSYAIWAGAGVVLAQMIGVVVFKEAVTFASLAGASLIIAGVAVLHLGGTGH